MRTLTLPPSRTAELVAARERYNESLRTLSDRIQEFREEALKNGGPSKAPLPPDMRERFLRYMTGRAAQGDHEAAELLAAVRSLLGLNGI